MASGKAFSKCSSIRRQPLIINDRSYRVVLFQILKPILPYHTQPSLSVFHIEYQTLTAFLTKYLYISLIKRGRVRQN
ncbi:hypothetical protein NVP1081O_184 [Vibrio phage 1.081.O._10N.286.52.C2]|nr:hypothetical protein NVP1081O_184 [Vibrio phage 1.081.O._10N.286.52.C2]